jgi:DNA repair exonuclease SbcCD ATPase subunit
MPPKKKKEDGQKKEKKPKSGPSATEQLNDQSKEFYLAQIRDLEGRIDRYQKKCDELEVKNAEFRQQFDQMEENKRDIVAFIKKKLDEKVDEISDLNDRLVGLQQSKDQDREVFEQQLQQLRTEYRETKDQLTSENMMLSGKLASLEEFRAQREELMSQMAKLEALIAEQASIHQEEIYNLEKKQVIDKDRLKKEMVTRVNLVAAEFRKASNRQMAETTKRTIRENVAISAQLSKMSDKTMELISGNDELKSRERHQRQMMELLQATELELTKKNLANQNAIRVLVDKCHQQEMALEESSAVAEMYHEMEAEVMQLRQQLEIVRNELTTLSQKNQLLEHELGVTKDALNDRVQTRQNLEHVLEDAAKALNDVLAPEKGEQCTTSQMDLVAKRATMLENLLCLLNSAADLGVGPSMADLRPQSMQNHHRRVSPRDLGFGELSSGMSLPPHYQPGDLGLVPRPDERLFTSRAAWPSETEKPVSVRKAPCQSVATQTVSAVKAMFFAEKSNAATATTGTSGRPPPMEDRRLAHNGPMLPAIVSTSSKPLCNRVY